MFGKGKHKAAKAKVDSQSLRNENESGSNVASNCSQSQQNADSPLASAPAAPSASPPEQSSTVPIQQRTSSPDPTPPQLTCKEVFDISLRGLYILSKTYDPNSNLRMFTTAAQHILVAGTDCFSGPRALDVINLDTIHRGFRHDYLTAFASLLVAEERLFDQTNLETSPYSRYAKEEITTLISHEEMREQVLEAKLRLGDGPVTPRVILSGFEHVQILLRIVQVSGTQQPTAKDR